MRFSRDRRGQSVVVGTVILFGFLILALSLYQVQVVPQENSDVEYEHSQQVEGEFLDIRNAVESASGTGDGRSTSLKLGTRYPQRTFALNPPAASGRLSTTEPRALRIENVTVNDGGNVGAYWSNRTNETATGDTITFDTRSLRYSPGYNEFRDAPDLVYEHSLVIAEFDSSVLGRSGQIAVDSDRNRVRLTALDGTVSESGVRRTSLDPETLSEIERSVRLNSTDGDPIVVELPTDVSMERADSLEQQWRDRLGDDAESVVVAGGTVRIELDGTEGYRLELGKVGLGSDATGTNESDGYITEVSSVDGVAVAEVRDRYNNPVKDADVEISVDGTTAETARTDADGRVSYEVGDVSDVEMAINDGSDTWDSVLFENVGAGVPGGGVESLLVAPEEAVAFNGPGSTERGGFQLGVENQHDTQVRITDVTVLPEDPRLNGLSDKADFSGPGRSELNVESENGAVGSKEVLLVDSEYTFVPNSGLRLNLQSGPEKRAYDTGSGEYIDAETGFSGVEVPLNSGEGATITLAEFYEVGQTGATVADVVGETFSVTVGYKTDGERRTKQFVTTVEVRPAGNVNLQDSIAPSAANFGVSTDQFQSLTTGQVVVENAATDRSVSFESTDGEITVVDSTDVGGLSDGDEITATLYESDAQETELSQDVTVVGGGASAINSFEVTDRSGNQARFDVDWVVTNDDDDLDSVDIELRSENGDIVDTVSNDVSGGGASGTDQLRQTGNPPAQTYTVRLTVTDIFGNEVVETREVEYAG
ncbi:Ig-like domain-containing protein [Halorubrum tebenquichense]|uniref:Uncharacterized protein n=1 Tax=Halorubrum tebenquichense DSM 14210 TaxID=1227485 RepID=M0DGQ4_9EURY|nr:Ig-like domain-containing protein [Halorubrum tebenquichense]ELZ34676.1 hypothetical protein C472_13102 [Halorubrum tebenquichense DSM 14210]